MKEDQSNVEKLEVENTKEKLSHEDSLETGQRDDNLPGEIITMGDTGSKWRHVMTNRTVLELCTGSAVVFVTYASIFTIAPNAADDYGEYCYRGNAVIPCCYFIFSISIIYRITSKYKKSFALFTVVKCNSM